MKIIYKIMLAVVAMLISVSTFAQPSNDNVCNAIAIVVDDPEVAIDNTGATAETNEVAPPFGNCANSWCDGQGAENSIWFTAVVPANGALIISTCSDASMIDSQIALWQAEDCSDFSSFTLVAASDDMPQGCDLGNTFSSYIDIDGLEAGTTYYIQVDGFDEQPDVPAPDSGFVAVLVQTGIPSSQVNLVHNSADVSISNLDIWIDGVNVIDNMQFRTSTGYEPMTAGVDHYIALCDQGDVDDSNPYYSTTVNLDGAKDYVFIIHGIASSVGYDPLTPLTIAIFDDAQFFAGTPGNVDILFFNGVSDAPTLDVVVQELGNAIISNDVVPGTFNATGYASVASGNYSLDFTDMNGNDIGLTYCGPFAMFGAGSFASTLLTSGFMDPSVNSDGPAFGVFVLNPFNGDFIELDAGVCVVPANDDVCDAIEIIVDAAPINATNEFATAQPGEVTPPNLPLNDPEVDCIAAWCDGVPAEFTIWFHFVAPPSGTAFINACFDVTFDSQIGVWQVGDCNDFGTFELAAANDDVNGGCNAGDLYASELLLEDLTPGETYHIQLDGWAGTTGPIQLQVTEIPTGVDELEENFFTVFPNPADESVRIQFKGNANGTLDIIDLTGKIVEQVKLNGSNKVDISKLASGVYTLRIGSASQLLIVE